MITLNYVGNKPIISPNGISFEGKEDKFKFIEPAAWILKLLLEFDKTSTEAKISPKKRMNEKEIFEIIKNSIKNIERIHKESIEKYLKKLEEEQKTIDEIPFLKDKEKEAFKNNLSIMKEYRTKRAGNKIIYEMMIKKIKELIIKKEIKVLKTPSSKSFLHVMESIKKSFNNLKGEPEAKLTIIVSTSKPPYICLER